MERMAEVVPSSDDQRLQHFASQSPWSHTELFDHVGRDVDALLGGGPDTCLIIDESAVAKKGDCSAGTARQWDGRRGKVDNCQVGVFSALACRDEVTLTGARLFLPKAWIADPARCKKAKIPPVEQVFRSKAQIALELVRHSRRQGRRFSWVGLDGGYGKEPWLLRALQADGERFVADVHCDQRIYLEDPEPKVPLWEGGRGRPHTKRVAAVDPVRVDAFARQQPAAAWTRVEIRDSTKGMLTVDVLHRRVWVWDGEEPHAHCWHLIVRREIDAPTEIKYTLSNTTEDTPTQRLVFQQAQRYWVEHALRNAKSEAGLDHYQLRSWLGWHHHMAMVTLAMLFLFEVRRENKELLPLISCHDVVEVLKVTLPKRNVTLETIYEQLLERHRRRAAATASARRKQERERVHSEH